MTDENQKTEEEKVNQELIRLAELRIKEIDASISNTSQKSVLIATASIASAVFFLTHSLKEAVNIVQIIFALLFFAVAVRAAISINWEGLDLTELRKFIKESANSSMSLIAMQKKLLLLYTEAITRMEGFHEEQKRYLKKSVVLFSLSGLAAVIFLAAVEMYALHEARFPDSNIFTVTKALLQGKDGQQG